MPPSERDSLAVAIIGAATARGLTIAVAESLTGGDLVSALVSVPGASAVVSGGVVAYNTAIKASVLGVDAALLEREGAVHPEVALSMARGVRSALAIGTVPASIGIATTGVAGPEPQDGRAVGLVYVAVVDADGGAVQEHYFAGDRQQIRAQATLAALSLTASRPVFAQVEHDQGLPAE